MRDGDCDDLGQLVEDAPAPLDPAIFASLPHLEAHTETAARLPPESPVDFGVRWPRWSEALLAGAACLNRLRSLTTKDEVNPFAEMFDAYALLLARRGYLVAVALWSRAPWPQILARFAMPVTDGPALHVRWTFDADASTARELTDIAGGLSAEADMASAGKGRLGQRWKRYARDTESAAALVGWILERAAADPDAPAPCAFVDVPPPEQLPTTPAGWRRWYKKQGLPHPPEFDVNPEHRPLPLVPTPAEMRERYPDWRDLVPSTLERAKQANRFVKLGGCLRELKTEFYAAKTAFVELLAELGHVRHVWVSFERRRTLEVYRVKIRGGRASWHLPMRRSAGGIWLPSALVAARIEECQFRWYGKTRLRPGEPFPEPYKRRKAEAVVGDVTSRSTFVDEHVDHVRAAIVRIEYLLEQPHAG